MGRLREVSAAPSLPSPVKAVRRLPLKMGGRVGVVRKVGVVDDPVRLYLLQMGGIPLLTRDTEVSSARRIEYWRRKFRDTMLGNDLKLDAGIGICGKEGQTVPVGVGQPTMKVDALTVGGTA